MIFPEKLRKCFISFVVVAQILVLVVWTAPHYRFLRPVVVPLRGMVGRTISFTGLWQNWSMFAPAPRAEDVQVTAIATMKDKSTRIWSIPNPLNLGFFRRHQIDRYRKWANDHLRNEQDDDVLKEAGRFIKEQVDEPQNPVEMIDFMYARKRIMLDNPAFDEWNEKRFYRYLAPGFVPPSDEAPQ